MQPEPSIVDESYPTVEPEQSCLPDDMFNYQCNLLDNGLLYINFVDALAEGDGDRIVRSWKFMLLQFYAQKKMKYAVEAQYLLLQQYCLLSQRDAYIKRWNRSTNNKGGAGKNVPLDLDLEHDNNYLKESIRKLGPNLSEASVQRCAKILKFAREKVEVVTRECQVMKKSGKHFIQSSKKDLAKIVNNSVEKKAFLKQPGRYYKHFHNIQSHPVNGNNLSGLCTWITNHKKGVVTGRKAR